jgi:hypothetical protein
MNLYGAIIALLSQKHDWTKKALFRLNGSPLVNLQDYLPDSALRHKLLSMSLSDCRARLEAAFIEWPNVKTIWEHPRHSAAFAEAHPTLVKSVVGALFARRIGTYMTHGKFKVRGQYQSWLL